MSAALEAPAQETEDPPQYDLTDPASQGTPSEPDTPVVDIGGGPKPLPPEPTPEPVAEYEPTEPEPAAPADEFGADLLAQANFYGISAEEARAYDSPKALMLAMTAIDRNNLRVAKEHFGSSYGPQPSQPAPQLQPQQFQPLAPQQPQQPPKLGAFEKLKLELNPEEFDEKSIAALNQVNEHYDKLMREQAEMVAAQNQALLALNEQFTQITSRQQAEAHAEFTREMDTFFTKLGDEFTDVFGKGDLKSLLPNSPQWTSRQQLVEEMELLRWVDAQANRPRSPDSLLAQRALNALHPDKLKATVRKELNSQVSQRRSQALARTAGRQNPVPKGDQNATNFARDWARQHGLGDYDESDVEFVL